MEKYPVLRYAKAWSPFRLILMTKTEQKKDTGGIIRRPDPFFFLHDKIQP